MNVSWPSFVKSLTYPSLLQTTVNLSILSLCMVPLPLGCLPTTHNIMTPSLNTAVLQRDPLTRTAKMQDITSTASTPRQCSNMLPPRRRVYRTPDHKFQCNTFLARLIIMDSCNLSGRARTDHNTLVKASMCFLLLPSRTAPTERQDASVRCATTAYTTLAGCADVQTASHRLQPQVHQRSTNRQHFPQSWATILGLSADQGRCPRAA